MKKLLLTFLASLAFVLVGKAQKISPEELQKFKAHFDEVAGKIEPESLLNTLDKDIDKNLSFKILYRGRFSSPEAQNTHPIGCFKRSENVGVFIYADGKKTNISVDIKVMTIHLGSGKIIQDTPIGVGQFAANGAIACGIDIADNKSSVSFLTASLAGRSVVKLEISESGKIKEIK